MGLPYDLNPQRGNRRQTLLRTIFFLIILGTLPFYLLGFILWGTAPDRSVQQPLNTPAFTNTPLGGEAAPTEPIATWTLRPTNTPWSIGSTPIQFTPPPVIPTRFLSPTPVFIPTSTAAPTLTLIPTSTPDLPTNTPIPPPTDTPLPAATTTPVPPPTLTHTPPPAPTDPPPAVTNTLPAEPTPLLPPTDTPAPGG